MSLGGYRFLIGNAQHSNLLLGSSRLRSCSRHFGLWDKAFKAIVEALNVCERRGFSVVQYPTVLSRWEREPRRPRLGVMERSGSRAGVKRPPSPSEGEGRGEGENVRRPVSNEFTIPLCPAEKCDAPSQPSGVHRTVETSPSAPNALRTMPEIR